ncbi:unnamed protein product [Paramecium sonneborni]|uniref:Uncharacterized protein n=1 Tax=Paramecium sonneborni TaxID=65129 RepID=A0A8S1RFV8_9CILI|nr:unnamed protein product [Paramecium sonneborni]
MGNQHQTILIKPFFQYEIQTRMAIEFRNNILLYLEFIKNIFSDKQSSLSLQNNIITLIIQQEWLIQSFKSAQVYVLIQYERLTPELVKYKVKNLKQEQSNIAQKWKFLRNEIRSMKRYQLIMKEEIQLLNYQQLCTYEKNNIVFKFHETYTTLQIFFDDNIDSFKLQRQVDNQEIQNRKEGKWRKYQQLIFNSYIIQFKLIFKNGRQNLTFWQAQQRIYKADKNSKKYKIDYPYIIQNKKIRIKMTTQEINNYINNLNTVNNKEINSVFEQNIVGKSLLSQQLVLLILIQKYC